MQNEQTSSSHNVNPKKRKGETISELAHRHLRDKNHTTTDEELRNATVELSNDYVEGQDNSLFEVDNTTVITSATTDRISTDKDVKSENGDNNNVPNPYSVLSK